MIDNSNLGIGLCRRSPLSVDTIDIAQEHAFEHNWVGTMISNIAYHRNSIQVLCTTSHGNYVKSSI
jgi:hypothetical protein